jgi:hypothetical protein
MNFMLISTCGHRPAYLTGMTQIKNPTSRVSVMQLSDRLCYGFRMDQDGRDSYCVSHWFEILFAVSGR